MNGCTKMLISEFDYDLPEELIAQQPAPERGGSRMLVLDPASGDMEIVPFSRFPEYMNCGDVLTVNDTKVIRARLFAKKETGAKIEIFLLGLADGGRDGKRWQCFMKPAKRVAPGTALAMLLRDGVTVSVDYRVRLLEKDAASGVCIVEFEGAESDKILYDCGHLPLPPYIKRADADADSERYQTVYAQIPGAVAAPTAGLHFTPETFRALAAKGVDTAKLTLHVGAGTFKPVDEDVVEDHKMHTERFFFTDETAAKLNTARQNGKRILAVGTTSLRTIETCVDDSGYFHPQNGETGIYIYPPYRIKSADMLLTNFHLPKSTLLMLVSAFAGMDVIRKAYQYAIQERMHFFSYGDCMLILNHI